MLDISGTLGHVLDRVPRQLQLILLVLAGLDLDTRPHDNLAHDLLADEVSDLNLVEAGLGVLADVDVDGEMGVDVAHLVLEALGDTDDHVVDQRADCAEGRDILARAVVQLDVDEPFLGVGEVDGQMGEVLDELAAGALDGHKARLDDDLDCRKRDVSARSFQFHCSAVVAGSRAVSRCNACPLFPPSIPSLVVGRSYRIPPPSQLQSAEHASQHPSTLSPSPRNRKRVRLTTLRHVKNLVRMNVLHLETLAGRVCR